MSARSLSSPNPAHKVIVAIDGPAGAGKSTVARHLARHFGLLNLETGAMYRAFAFKALRVGLPLNESAGLESLAQHLVPAARRGRIPGPPLDQLAQAITGSLQLPLARAPEAARGLDIQHGPGKGQRSADD